jgi:hypothetical protein
VEVINGGTSGYDLQHFVFQMDLLNKAYKPDYNFLFFNLNNDYLSSMLSTAYLVSRNYYDLEDDNLIFRKKKYRVPTQSFGMYFVDSLSKYDDLITAPWMAKKKRFEVSGIWGKSFLLYQFYDRFSTGLKYKEYSEEAYYNSAFQLNYGMYVSDWKEYFLHGHQLIEKLFGTYNQYQDTKTVVIIIPSRAEVIDSEDVKKYMLKYSGESLEPNFDIQYQKLISSFDKLGMEYINLQNVFMEHPDREALYLKDNEHISPLAHKILATEITNYLKNQ